MNAWEALLAISLLSDESSIALLRCAYLADKLVGPLARVWCDEIERLQLYSAGHVVCHSRSSYWKHHVEVLYMFSFDLARLKLNRITFSGGARPHDTLDYKCRCACRLADNKQSAGSHVQSRRWSRHWAPDGPSVLLVGGTRWSLIPQVKIISKPATSWCL